MSGTTTIVTNRDGRRLIIGEHEIDVYVALEPNAVFLNPIDAIRAGMALIEAGGAAIERQLAHQSGSKRSVCVAAHDQSQGASPCAS